MKYCRGQTVVCKWKGTSTNYEAKIIDVSSKRKKTPYKVHYLGWKNKWDEWIGEERIMKVKTTRSRVNKNFELDASGSVKNSSTVVASTSKRQSEVHLGEMAVASSVQKPKKTQSCLVDEQKQSPKLVESLSEAAGTSSSTVVTAHNHPVSNSNNKNNTSVKETTVSSVKNGSSRKRKTPTGWIRRSSRTQKLQMQQLGISEELVDKLMKDIDMSSVSDDNAKPESSGEGIATESASSSEKDGVKRIKATPSCTNVSFQHKRHHVKSKKLKVLLSAEASSKVEVNDGSANKILTASGLDKSMSLNAEGIAVRQKVNSGVKIEQSCAGCKPGPSFSSNTQYSNNVKTEEANSDSHSADMTSPTTAIVNIAFELAQSFPSLSENLPSRFLSLSPAAVKLDLVNDLKSCEKCTFKSAKAPSPSVASLPKNLVNSSGPKNSYMTEAVTPDVSKRRSYDNMNGIFHRDPVLFCSPNNNSPQLLNTERFSPRAEILSSSVVLPKNNNGNTNGHFYTAEDVELTDGPEFIDLQGGSSKVVSTSAAFSKRSGGSKLLSISEFARRIYGARKKMAYQRSKDLLPYKTTYRLGLADIFRRNQHKLGTECDNLLDVPSTSNRPPLCSDPSSLSEQPLSFQKPHLATQDSTRIARPSFTDNSHSLEPRINHSTINSTFVVVNEGCCTNDLKSNGCQRTASDEQYVDEVVLPECVNGDAGEQIKVKKRPKFEDFIPLPPLVLEDHCYIKIPSSFYPDVNKCGLVCDNRMNIKETTENGMATESEIVDSRAENCQKSAVPPDGLISSVDQFSN